MFNQKLSDIKIWAKMLQILNVTGTCIRKVPNLNHEVKRTRFVYNSNAIQIKSRTVGSSEKSGCDNSFTKNPSKVCLRTTTDEADCSTVVVPLNLAVEVTSSPVVSTDLVPINTVLDKSKESLFTDEVIFAAGGLEDCKHSQVTAPIVWSKVNSSKVMTQNGVLFAPHILYDVNYSGVQDKFFNSILPASQFIGIIPNVDTEIYHKWRNQSDFRLCFVQVMLTSM